MKTLETLYQEVLASDELKKGLAEAAKTPEGLKAWICAQGCEATLEQVQAFLKEKQEKTGELTDDELGERRRRRLRNTGRLLFRNDTGSQLHIYTVG